MTRPEFPPNRRVRMGLTGHDVSDDVLPSKITVVGLVVPVVVLLIRRWLLA